MAMSKESAMCKEMREAMHNYRKSGLFIDLAIVTDDRETEILAHKVVLASVHWQFKTRINNERILRLHGYNGDDIEKVIDFIYTEYIDITQTNDAIKFSNIAKKLGLQYLVQFTIDNLIEKSKNIDDCLEIWRFARDVKDTKLENSCEQFISSNFKNFIEKSIKILSYVEMKLLLKISKLSDFGKYEIIKKWGALNNSMDRKCEVKELFDKNVNWSQIKNEDFPKISLDPYMLRNFQNIIVEELVNDRLTEPKWTPTKSSKLKKEILNWDSYPESD